MADRFSSSRAAKEYLIERIVAQAKQDGIELDEIERKMLYFTGQWLDFARYAGGECEVR